MLTKLMRIGIRAIWNNLIRNYLFIFYYNILILKSLEIISAVSIHWTPVKIWNIVYKCWVRPELQHDVIRRLGHCVIAIMISWTLNWLKSILILSSHLRLGLPKGLFPVGLPFKILKALLIYSILTAWHDITSCALKRLIF